MTRVVALFVGIFLLGQQAWAQTTYVGPIPYTPSALTDGSTIAVNALLSDTFTLTIAGTSHKISNPTNLIAGQRLLFIITQNATGGFTPLWDTAYAFPYGLPQINSGASQVTMVSCIGTTTTALQCASTATSGVTNVYTSNTLAPTAQNTFYSGTSRLSILSPRVQLLNGLK